MGLVESAPSLVGSELSYCDSQNNKTVQEYLLNCVKLLLAWYEIFYCIINLRSLIFSANTRPPKPLVRTYRVIPHPDALWGPKKNEKKKKSNAPSEGGLRTLSCKPISDIATHWEKKGYNMDGQAHMVFCGEALMCWNVGSTSPPSKLIQQRIS